MDIPKLLQTVESIRARRAALDAQIEHVLGIDHTVAELTEIYEELGEDVDEEILRQATDVYGEEVIGFREPEPSAALLLARAWVRRYAIVVPIVVGFAVVGVVVGGFKAARHIETEQRRAKLGQTIEAFCRRANGTRSRIDRLERRLANLKAETRADAEAVLIGAQGELNDMRLDELCAYQGDDRIPDGEVVELDVHLQQAKIALSRLDKNLLEADKLVRLESDLSVTRANLEKTISSVRETDAPPATLRRGEKHYRKGIEAVEARDLDTAKDQLAELRHLHAGVEAVARMGPEVEAVTARIERVSKEPDATARARELRDRARTQVAIGDSDGLRDTHAQLRDLLKQLELEYTLVIFGADWRHPNENPTAQNFYLLVEARRGLGGTGPVVGRRILNEETGKEERVCGWGERVDESAYRRVERDKKDNGLIDQKVFGLKRTGHLTPEYTEGFTPIGGRITSWDRGSPAKARCE